MERHIVMDVLQVILAMTLFLWLVAFGFSFMFQQNAQYMRWTGQTLREVWRRGWPFIVGTAFGYFLAGQGLLEVTL